MSRCKCCLNVARDGKRMKTAVNKPLSREGFTIKVWQTMKQLSSVNETSVTEFFHRTNKAFTAWCIYLTKGVHPALSLRLGSAPWSNSSLTASTSPCRTRTEQQSCGQNCRPVNGTLQTQQLIPTEPVFINHTTQWPIDYLVWAPEGDYSYVYKDYCEKVYS